MEKSSNKLKLILLGDAEVGKTSIVNQFINKSFNPSAEPTVGIDFFSKTIDFNNNNIRMFIYDIVFLFFCSFVKLNLNSGGKRKVSIIGAFIYP